MVATPMANPSSQQETPIPALVTLTDITKCYGQGDAQVYALKGVNLRIDVGEYCAIMGASGSGKSTLMNILGCLDRPSEGNYVLDGEEVAHLGDDRLAIVRNRKLGFIFQQFHLLPQLSALENVILPMIYANIPAAERRERAIQALENVGLGHRLHNRPNQLSGGQQQRVAIARAIVNQPVLLLADEPTGALDSQTTDEILHIFRDLHHQGMTIVVVTHELEVSQQAQRVIHFRDGQILEITGPVIAPAG